MVYRARVVLCVDGLGIHLTPANQLIRSIRGLDALVFFSNEHQEFQVTGSILELITAHASFLLSGSAFDVRCEGVQAAEAFLKLKECFTTGAFEGCTFQEYSQVENR